MDARTLNSTPIVEEPDRSEGMCNRAVRARRLPRGSEGRVSAAGPTQRLTPTTGTRSVPVGATADYRGSIPTTDASARRMLEQLRADLCHSLNRLDEAKMRSALLIEYHASASDRTAERLSLHLAARITGQDRLTHEAIAAADRLYEIVSRMSSGSVSVREAVSRSVR